MEIQPASIDQLAKDKDGRQVLIEADVGGVVSRIKAVDSRLRVRFSEAGGYYVVYWKEHVFADDKLITTSQTLDHRLAARIEKIASPDYDFVKEMDRLDAQADKDKEDRIHNHIGDLGERLAHALRKDLGVNKDSARSKRSWGKGIVGP